MAYESGSNRFVAVWEDGATNRIYGRAIASGGGPAGGIQTLSGTSGGGFKFANIAAGPAGELLAVWSHGGGVRARRVRASDAAPLGSEIVVSGGGQLADVAYNPLSNEYLVVWEQGGSILARRYNSGGGALTGPFNPFTFGANRGHPVVGFCPARPNGTFVVTMYRGGPGSWDLDRQLVAGTSGAGDGGGQLIGATFGASTPAGGEQTAQRIAVGCRQGTRPGVAEWLMHAWDDNRSGNKDIYARRLDVAPPPVPAFAPEPAFTAGLQNGLDWNDVVDGGIRGERYEIQRADNAAFSAGLVTVSNLTASDYLFIGLNDGQTYYYRVRVRDAVYNRSEWSTAVISSTQDATPPATTVTITATLGSNGWYTTTAQAGLSSVDPSPGLPSGLNQTLYNVDGAGWGAYSGAPIGIGTEGGHSLQFYAVDNAGNTEVTQSRVISIDTIAPALNLTRSGPAIFQPSAGQVVTFTYSLSDITSGVDSWSLTIYNQTNTAVRTLTGSGPVAANLVWNGTDDGGASLPDGPYRVVFNGRDIAGWSRRAEESVILGRASFAATPKTADRNIVLPGDVINYTIHLANTGNLTATNIVVTDPLPALVAFEGPASPPAVYITATHTLSFTLAQLPPGGYQPLRFTVRVTRPLTNGVVLSNTAYIRGDGLNPAQTNALTTLVDSRPDLHLVKTAAPNSGLLPGSEVEFTLTYSNTGTENATGVVITDTVPAGTALVPGSINGGGVFITATNTISWPIGNLPTCTANPAACGGMVSFRVRVGNTLEATPPPPPGATPTPTPTPIAGPTPILTMVLTPTAAANGAATDGSLTIKALTGTVATTATIQVFSHPPAPTLPTGMFALGNRVYEFRVTDPQNNPVSVLSLPITLTFTYDDTQLGGVAESSLAAWYYHTGLGSWEKLNGVVDTAANTFTLSTANIGVLGSLGLMAAPPAPTATATADGGPATAVASPTETITPTGTATPAPLPPGSPAHRNSHHHSHPLTPAPQPLRSPTHRNRHACSGQHRNANSHPNSNRCSNRDSLARRNRYANSHN